MLNIALKIPLAFFDFIGLFQSHHARTTRIQMLHKALNRATLACGIASFKQTHNALPCFFHPRLHFQQLNLQQLLVVLIHTAAHAGFVRIRQRQRRRIGIFGATALRFQHFVGKNRQGLHCALILCLNSLVSCHWVACVFCHVSAFLQENTTLHYKGHNKPHCA